MTWEAEISLPFLKATSQKFKKRFFFKNCVNLLVICFARKNTNANFLNF